MKTFSQIIDDLISYGYEITEYQEYDSGDVAIMKRDNPFHRVRVSCDGLVNNLNYKLWLKLNIKVLVRSTTPPKHHYDFTYITPTDESVQEYVGTLDELKILEPEAKIKTMTLNQLQWK